MKITPCLVALLLPLPAAAAAAQEFPQCISSWQDQARSQQFPPRVVDQVIPALQSIPRVLELDRRQPEFTSSFADYLDRRVTSARIERGQELLETHRELLQQLTQKYGVPGRYIVSFWGLETNYGGYLGDLKTLDALATLACDPRRSEYFTAELFNALRLLERYSLEPDAMRGSWAGAMGHTQFMPSNYARYGIDGDGDGQVDLWNSVPDALTSAAYFLSELGWQPELRWGREVALPKDFDYSQAGRSRPRSLREWSKSGIRLAGGGPLPVDDLKAALLVPAGHRGPAFLVYDNFRIIMRWNHSEFYAISVGHLADRLVGLGGLLHPPPPAEKLSIATVKQLQETLSRRGFNTGTPDGVVGPATRQAISDFQKSRGMIADGYHSPELIEAVLGDE